MKKSQVLIILALLILLLAINLVTHTGLTGRNYLGGLPWWGWAGMSGFLIIIAAGFALRDAARARRLLEEPVQRPHEAEQRGLLSQELLLKYDPDGPEYPHPVIVAERCIGCHACVEACPHDVLAIVNGISTPVARDQCMEDTSCQVECPVNPKACIVVNTRKKIPPRKVPSRDASFMTNVPGCYIIGDVSGTPLIKNAANEGADVIKHIAHELHNGAGAEPKADTDVAIIGAGPAGLSAAVMAKLFNLRYVGIEQDKVMSTIEAYPKGKYVFLKPETMDWRGGIDLPGLEEELRGHLGGDYDSIVKAYHEGNLDPEQRKLLEAARHKVLGDQREKLLDRWSHDMKQNGVVISENESCKAVKKAEDGDYFTVQTEKGLEKQPTSYRARRVVLAIGNRGTPMKLRVAGEEMKVTRDGRTEDKVKYKLTDPEAYRNKKIIVVGAGNSAIEGAVDLVARRDGDQITVRPDSERNQVTLVIRSDLKNDLKFGNKQQVYDCIDNGLMKVYFNTAIKEIRDGEVVLMNSRTQEEKATVPNDYIFAMIGGDRPTKFLEGIGIKIG